MLDHISIRNKRKRMINGMMTPILMLIRYTRVAISHHKARDQESHMKIRAGFMLYRRKAIIDQITIQMMVVARYRCEVNVIIHNTHKTIRDSHQASQSSQSAIFIAFTIHTVKKNQTIGRNSHSESSDCSEGNSGRTFM